MKKTFKIAAFALVLIGFSTVFAQEANTEKTASPRYPHYGFWSNWSIGINGGWTYRLQKETLNNREMTFNNDHRNGWGIGGLLAKQLNHVWDVRFKVNYADVDSKIKNNPILGPEHLQETPYGIVNYTNYIGKHLNFNVDFTFSIIDAIKGYQDPYRKCRLYLLAGLGGTAFLDDDEAENQNGEQKRWFGNESFSANFGLGFDWRCCEHFSLYVEPSIWVIADLPTVFDGDIVGTYLYVPLGLKYHFGVTAADKARIAQEALLTQENFDNLQKQLEECQDDLAACNKNEQDLKNKIAALEDENGQLKDRLDKTEAENNRLRNKLKDMKDNQQKYYGLPVSILYPNDIWKVQPSEKGKLDAIAKIMKEDTTVNFTIVGSCDYTASDEYNDKLSEKRANEVKRLLVKKYGIDGDRLTTVGKGKRECFGDCKLSINRRVSFYVNMED